jgi:hypothetical protein
MVGAHLGAVVVAAPLAQQQGGTRMVQTGVVQDGQAGIPERVRPDVIVVRRIAELIDDQIVRLAAMAPRKIVGHRLGKRVDDMAARPEREYQLGATRRHAGFHWWQRTEPRNAHGPIVIACEVERLRKDSQARLRPNACCGR